MFVFFKNGEFVNFWSNQIGNIFALQTCKSLNWELSTIDLLYYPSLESIPENHSFDASKILSVFKKEIDQTPVLDENGEEMVDEKGNPVIQTTERLVLLRQIDPLTFMSKGIIVKPC